MGLLSFPKKHRKEEKLKAGCTSNQSKLLSCQLLSLPIIIIDNQQLISNPTLISMYSLKPKRQMSYRKRYNALTAADIQALQ
jgi:hypothetical protein